MKPAEIAARRLHLQGIARAKFDRPEDVVAWFGAVQAQDYLGALWAIGQRTRRATEAMVEDAETRRAIVRTWPMRGTLHFVAAADARWLLRLLVPRVIARNQARWTREMGVTASLVERAYELAHRALEGGRRLARNELYAVLEAGRIGTGNSRGLHLLMWLSMQGRLCLAGRSGKQQTFALLDEWLPSSPQLEGEAALAELARRYFTSHGPATLKDFIWWSGLTVREARVAIDAAGSQLSSVTAGDTCWWSGDAATAPRRQASPLVRLLPAYDEYTVGYQDRSSLLPAGKRLPSMALLAPVVVVDGLVTGTWKRSLARGVPRMDIRMSRKLTPPESRALEEQMQRYRKFVASAAG